MRRALTFKSFCYFFVRVTNEEGKRKRERQNERLIFQLLIHSPHACNSQGRTSPKPETLFRFPVVGNHYVLPLRCISRELRWKWKQKSIQGALICDTGIPSSGPTNCATASTLKGAILTKPVFPLRLNSNSGCLVVIMQKLVSSYILHCCFSVFLLSLIPKRLLFCFL